MKNKLLVSGIVVLVIISLVYSNISSYKRIVKLNESNDKYKVENESLKNKEQEYIDKISSLNKEPFPYRDKTCNYVDTYYFVDYLDYNGFIEDMFFIIVDKEMTKEAPLIIMLDSNKFEKDFVKNQNYEFTFKKMITYKEDTKVFWESTDVIKIEPTDKRGMEQNIEVCKFE